MEAPGWQEGQLGRVVSSAEEEVFQPQEKACRGRGQRARRRSGAKAAQAETKTRWDGECDTPSH